MTTNFRLVNALYTHTMQGTTVFVMLTHICRLKLVLANIPGECGWSCARIVSIGMALHLVDTACVYLESPEGLHKDFHLACTNPGDSGQASSLWASLQEYRLWQITTLLYNFVGLTSMFLAAIWLRRQERVVGTTSQVRRLRNVNYTRSTDSIGMSSQFVL